MILRIGRENRFGIRLLCSVVEKKYGLFIRVLLVGGVRVMIKQLNRMMELLLGSMHRIQVQYPHRTMVGRLIIILINLEGNR